jgi:hypothetical protein
MTRKLGTLLVIVSFALFAFAFTGCGGDDESAATETTATETTTTEETETEATETEATETEETEETETTDTSESSDFASAENCQEFAQIGAQVSGALTGTTDVDQIKADFQTLADYMTQVAEALQGVDLTSPNPDPQALAKLQALDSAAATQASTNISKWVAENCTGATP